jgi:Protein of unknown function (DUF4013)
MDIGKAFSYVFDDERWISKVLIGGLLIWIPIVNFAVFGYMVKVAQNVAQGIPRPLPEWGEFGDHFMRGFYVFVIYLVYLLPIFILEGLFFCVTGGLASGSRQNNGGAAAGLLGLCFVPLIIILALAISFVLYAAIARYVATNSLSESFKFAEVIASVRSNFSPWLMLWLVALLAGLVGGVGAIACGVGLLFTSFYAQCVIGHALGQTVAQQGQTNPYATQQVPPIDYNPPSMQ